MIRSIRAAERAERHSFTARAKGRSSSTSKTRMDLFSVLMPQDCRCGGGRTRSPFTATWQKATRRHFSIERPVTRTIRCRLELSFGIFLFWRSTTQLCKPNRLDNGDNDDPGRQQK